MARTLIEVIPGLPISPAAGCASARLDTQVGGIRADNRRIRQGDLFAGHTGGHVHGARFARAAVAAGAVAVLTDHAGLEVLADPASALPAEVPVLVAADVPAILGRLAAEIYDHPAERLRTFAVTGTNGKTTTAYFLEHALAALGRRTGLIGTVEIRTRTPELRAVPAQLTTPQPADLQALLADMAAGGVTDLAMEVSSHALDLGRVDPVVFDVAGFTNLTQDHLDHHGTMAEYFGAKASLFTPERSAQGVTMADDAWGQKLSASRPGGYPIVAVGTRPDVAADWRVTAAVAEGTGSRVTMSGQGRSLSFSTALPGDFNVANASLAVAMLLAAGTDPSDLESVLAHAGGLSPVIPGRMELLATAPRVIVDFAHNPGGLAVVLSALRSSTAGKLHVVFGAAGSRDASKRAEMAELAVRYGDQVTITDDDPHDEPAAAIRADLLAPARASAAECDIREISDRRAAIREAIVSAEPADTVLIAGRGHETIQEIAGVEHHLDDREEVRSALQARAGGEGGAGEGRSSR